MDIVQAVMADNAEEVKKCLSRGENPNSLNYFYNKEETIVFEAVRNSVYFLGDDPKERYVPSPVLMELISYGVDLNSRNSKRQTPIFFASNAGTIKPMMDHGAEVLSIISNQEGMSTAIENPANIDAASAIFSHTQGGDFELLKELKNFKNQTCMFWNEDPEIFKWYRDNLKIQYNYLDSDGRSIWHTHCIGNHTLIIPLLIDMDLDINIVDKFNCTPLHYIKDADFKQIMYNIGAVY